MKRQASPKSTEGAAREAPIQFAAAAGPRLLPVVVLLTIGLAFWTVNLGAHTGGWRSIALVGAAAIAAMIPASRHAISRVFDRVRYPGPRSATRAAVVVALLASGYLLITATWQETFLELRLPDEFSYLIQARMIAAGYLWHAPHPPQIRPFFDTINLLVEPTYGSMYFPGTALFYVPAVWLGIPFWVVALILSGTCAGVLYRLFVDLVDGVYALVAVLMLLGLSMFRATSVMLLSQTPMLLMGLLMMLAYFRWRRRFDWRWAALIGLLAGWSGITRPADALCYAVPIGIAMLFDLARSNRAGSPPGNTRQRINRPWLVTAACLVLPALPFLALQVVQNIGMTGHWWEFPEARYADETYPAPMLGFHEFDDASWERPVSARKRLLSETFADAFYSTHRLADAPRTWWLLRLPETCLYGLPHVLLAALLPAGLLGLRTSGRTVLAVTLLAFVSFYFFYVFYIPHYMIVIAPALALLVVQGGAAIASAVESILPRTKSTLAVAMPLAIGGLSVGSLPEINPGQRDHTIFPSSEVVYVQLLLDDLASRMKPSERAIVLFRIDLTTYLRAGEPVYTADVPWPDEARIIRATDLGPKNIDLFRYYATTCGQPDRLVYVYDSASGKLGEFPIGTVGALSTQN